MNTAIPSNLDDLDKLTPDQRMDLLWSLAHDARDGRLKGARYALRVVKRIGQIEREYYREALRAAGLRA